MSSSLYFLILIFLKNICSPPFSFSNNPDNKKKRKIIISILLLLVSVKGNGQIPVSTTLDAGNISTWIISRGIFNQDIRINNSPGFQWPKGSGKFAIFTSGLGITALVNDSIRMAAASYSGEYIQGYCVNGQFFTDSSFKFYKINRGDNYINNPDWLNWGLMVPYGAPFVDVDGNGSYNYLIDTPGVSGAAQTVFICITDANPNTHTCSEGIGGGSLPLGAEVHLTAFVYDNTSSLKDIQFFKWEVVNKSNNNWNAVHFGLYCDFDIGNSDDDFLGCDTNRNLAFAYNADNVDGTGRPNEYGLNPPAAGIMLLHCYNINSRITSFIEPIKPSSGGGPSCEYEPGCNLNYVYNFYKGIKRDGTPYVVPLTNPPQITKYCYTGDPETASGWIYQPGKIHNCGGSLTGNYIINHPGDKWSLTSYGSNTLNIAPGEKHNILYAQLIARGSDNLNSVTMLKQLADTAINFCENISVGISNNIESIPLKFNLYQNYPNPFNPVTTIAYDIPVTGKVSLKIFDITGKEIVTLVNEFKTAGNHSVNFNASDLSSGIYLYKITVNLNGQSYISTKRMVLLK